MIKFLDLQKINLKYQNEIEEAIISVYRSGWFVLVKEVESFEKALANYCSVKNIIGVANGVTFNFESVYRNVCNGRRR